MHDAPRVEDADDDFHARVRRQGGDAEIELAFASMFGTFGEPFFDAYESITPLDPGFHELRGDLYNLYPLLVHVRLFGASYVSPIERTLARLGL